MAGRKRQRAGKRDRRVCLQFDRLENLQLLSTGTGVHHSLGSFIAPSVTLPRISQPIQIVDPHVAINSYESGILGAEIQPIQQVVENQNTSEHSNLVEDVLGDPFVHATLSDQDTYTLLNSSGMAALIGVTQIQAGQSSSTGTVTYVLPESSIVTYSIPDSIVSVPSSGGLSGFVAVVPTTNIRTLSSGYISVAIPQSQIPANAPPPTNVSVLTGSLADVFASTGPVIVSALQTGLPLRAPNAPATVPGLRLARAIAHDRNLPLSSTHQFLRMFHVAIERGVFTLNSTQLDEVSLALQQFEQVVTALNQQGTFTPTVPPAAPPLPRGQLSGTLEVSTGALTNLVNVAAGQTGLPLPGIGNFPGRLKDLGKNNR